MEHPAIGTLLAVDNGDSATVALTRLTKRPKPTAGYSRLFGERSPKNTKTA
jgi:hypothetical protein